MQKRSSIIRQSLSTKMSLWLVAFVAVMLVTALFVMFVYARKAVKTEALAKSEAALDGMVQIIDNKLREVEIAAKNFHWYVENHIDDSRSLQELTRRMLDENPSVVGCAVAMNPDLWHGDDTQTMFCSYRGEDSIAISDCFGERPYVEQEWYTHPMTTGLAEWSNPTIEPLRGGYPIMGYSIPLKQEGRIIGIFVTAISLEWLSRTVEATRPFPSTFCALMNKDGNFIVHPDSASLYSGNIYDQLLNDYTDEDSKQLAHAMLSGESGYMTVNIYGVDCYVFYRPYKNTGWSVNIVSPKDEVFATYNRLQTFMVVILIISVLLLLIYCFHVIHLLFKPLRYLDHSVQRLASGHFDEPIADSLRHDEIGGLQRSFVAMQCSLVNYISKIRQHSAMLREQTVALNHARRKAHEADCLESAFIHNMTDQMVRPVNDIVSTVAVIRKNYEHLEQVDVNHLTSDMIANTEKVTTLLDKIIDISVNRISDEHENTESHT